MASEKTLASEKPTFSQSVEGLLRKYKVGVLPESMRTAKPDSKDLMDIAKPSLIGIPFLLVLYLIWDVTGFATGLAIIVAIAILDASRPLRNGYWLLKPDAPEMPSDPASLMMLAEGLDPEGWWGKKVQDALNAYGIKATVVAMDTSGATMDVYELEVQKGFDINVVTTLGDNFARALALPKGERVLVDANIGNGRAALFIPKKESRAIPAMALIPQAKDSQAILPGLIGEDLVGKPLVVDITQAPHLLVGGEIGNERLHQLLNMVLSSAYHCAPTQLQITLIDPKRIELQVCNALPHVLEPVITDMHKAYSKLQQLQVEMDKRCQQLLDAGVSNIAGYNAMHVDDPMPYQLVIISEIFLMLQTGQQANATQEEERLGQALKTLLIALVTAAPAQSIGVHFLFGIQCFDAKTCGQTLRQGIPSSIGLRVRGQAFSEMLIGQAGCETLGKNGECYVYMSGDASPVRAQVAAATEAERAQLVQEIKEKWNP